MPLGRLEGLDHFVHYLFARQDVALRGAVFAELVSCPGGSFRAGERGGFAFGVGDGELTALLGPVLRTGVGIGFPNLFDDLFRGASLLEQRQRLRAIADVHNRLRSRRSHISLGPQHSVANREDARLHGPADLAGVRIETEDGKSRDGRPRLSCLLGCAAQQTTQPWPPVATFSILGFDPDTGEVGGAVQSRVFSVGNGVLWAEADVGAAATQAIVDVSYGPQALALLKKGGAPKEIIKQIWESDPDPRPQDWTKQGGQFAVIAAKGEAASFTGPNATAWAGHKLGKYCTAQGNILASEEVVNKMVEAFETTKGHLSLRLLAALEAGQAAGGDKRGMQSAAMLIVKKDGGVWLHNDTVLRLQVDDNPEPIRELRRLVEKAAGQRSRIRR